MFVVFVSLFCAFLGVTADTSATCFTDNICLTKHVDDVYKSIFKDTRDKLDPMFQDIIDADLSVLKFKLIDTTVEGFKECNVENAKMNLEKTLLNMDLLCPRFAMYGKYNISGRLMTLPIEGNGDYRIDAKAYRISLHVELNLTKSFIGVKILKLDAEALEGVVYDLKNLFNGQKDLADPVLKFANENWKEVSQVVQIPILTANLEKIAKAANKYFKTLLIEKRIKL